MSKLAVVPPPDEAGDAAEASEAVPAKKSPLPLLIAAVALIGGGALGAFVIAPMFGAKPAAPAAAAAAGKHEEVGEGELVEIDNLIVNPEGAQGLHYLMATVSVEVAGKDAQSWISGHEHLLRDMLLTTLGRESLDSLCKPDVRDRLKRIIAAQISDVTPGHPDVAVYLPQFVVQ